MTEKTQSRQNCGRPKRKNKVMVPYMEEYIRLSFQGLAKPCEPWVRVDVDNLFLLLRVCMDMEMAIIEKCSMISPNFRDGLLCPLLTYLNSVFETVLVIQEHGVTLRGDWIANFR